MQLGQIRQAVYRELFSIPLEHLVKRKTGKLFGQDNE